MIIDRSEFDQAFSVLQSFPSMHAIVLITLCIAVVACKNNDPIRLDARLAVGAASYFPRQGYRTRNETRADPCGGGGGCCAAGSCAADPTQTKANGDIPHISVLGSGQWRIPGESVRDVRVSGSMLWAARQSNQTIWRRIIQGPGFCPRVEPFAGIDSTGPCCRNRHNGWDARGCRRRDSRRCNHIARVASEARFSHNSG